MARAGRFVMVDVDVVGPVAPQGRMRDAAQVMAAVGLSLPRDAHEQFLFCRERPITRSPRPGDLLFFGRRGGRMTHVAIALGGGSFGHARGTVRVNSLLEANPLYDKVLARSLRAIGRPEPGLRHSC